MEQNRTTKSTTTFTARRLTSVALITAVICVIAPFSIPLPFSPVPLTFTNFILFVSIYIIGWKNVCISLLIYLLLGAAGLPVFSGFSGGLGKLAGPTGGYLIGFVFMIVIAGIFIERFSGKRVASMAGMAIATIVTYMFGTAWLAVQMELSFAAALSVGVFPYMLGDALKIIIAALIGPGIRKQIQRGTPFF